MIIIQKEYLASLILILTFITIESAGTKTTSKLISLRYKTRSLENFNKHGSSSFVFGACDPRSKSWQRSCTFAIQTKKPTDSLDHVKICDFQIKAHSSDAYIGQILEVHAFSDDKAILKFTGKYNFIRFAILNFTNCEAGVSKIDDDFPIKIGNVVASEDDTFDISERKYDKSCRFFGYKKMILDSGGNIITDLIDWLCDEEPNIIGAISSPLKGHLIVDASSMLQKKVRILEVGQDVTTVLKEYSNDELFVSTVAISNTELKFSICYQMDIYLFNCSQFDHNGGLQFETSFKFEHHVRSVSLYNLPIGGFLVLAQESIHDDEIAIVKTHPEKLVVSKINGQGKLVKIVELPEEFDHAIDFEKIHFHVDENNEYCFSYVIDSSLKQNDKLVKLSVTCFNESSLISSN